MPESSLASITQTARQMKFLLFTVLAGALLAILPSPSFAQVQLGYQFPTVRLFSITPPGGRQGTTVEVMFTGADLDSPSAMLFSHPGIRAVAVIPPPPPPKQDPKAKPDPKKPEPKKEPPPPPAVTKFTVTIASDVAPGNYDVRLVNKYGVSNPRVFVVGTLPEVVEKEGNNDVDQAQRVEPGTTINGVMNNNVDVDYFVFAGRKGQRIVVSCLGASIDSRLTPEIRLLQRTDATGEKELTTFRAAPLQDGVLDHVLPADGDYLVRLNQFTYLQGSPEYFYRLTISTGPWIDSVHPPMIEPGKPTTVTVYGRNLPGGALDPSALLHGRPLEKLTVIVTAPNEPLQKLNYTGHLPPVSGTLDGFEYRLYGPSGVSNAFFMTFAQAPVVLENDANDSPEKAQAIPAPVEVAGRVDKRRDRDWYAFSAKKGDVYMIELYSQRLGAPTDMVLAVRNPATKQDMTLLDDTPEVLNLKTFFNSHRDPPPYRFLAPADGKYHILVSSHLAELHADPTHYYRLRISPEKPDFRLIVLHADDYRPDALSVGQAGSRNLWVYAQRTDGFKGEIKLAIERLPMGLTCRPQILGPGQKQTMLVVTAAENAPSFTGEIRVKGTAQISGQTVIREARPASVTWPTQPQQNIPAISRLDRQLMLAVRDKSLSPYQLVTGVDKATVSVGDKVSIPVKLLRHNPEFKGPLPVQLVQGDLPPNITFANIVLSQAKKEEKKDKKKEKKDAKPEKKEAKPAKETKPPPDDEGVLVVSVASNVQPGTYNLVFRSAAQMPPAPKAKSVNVVLPSTPVALLVLPKQVASLSVNNANPALKPGTQAEVIVKVNRMYDFDGPFKVKLVLPQGVKDILADEVAIPAGQSEVKLILRTPQGAPPGNRQNISVQAIAVINGNVTLTHETKINVNITK